MTEAVPRPDQERPNGAIQDGLQSPGDRLNLDDHIYERLRTMVANGELLPGERIVAEQLAAKMGVSRTPIISALKRLSQGQVLEWRSRRGVYVRRLRPRELALIFEVREVLEGLAARRAAETVTAEEIAQLRGLFKEISAVESPANRHHYIRQDYLFHVGLLELADSAPLSRTMASVNILVLAFTGGPLRSIREVFEEHEAILTALAARDPVAAEAAARVHVHRSVEWLLQQADSFENSEKRLPGLHLREASVP